MITTVPDVPDIVARINEELPPEIRLWGYVSYIYRPYMHDEASHIFTSGSGTELFQCTPVCLSITIWPCIDP